MNNQIGNKINDKTYIPLPPFKGWVLENFPFIEDDFDCLTNYQMLCLMFKKLNEVISNQNQVQELGSELVVLYNALVDAVNSAINEFETEVTADINQFKIDTNTEISNFETFITGKFNELKDYVDNFFDNNFPEMVSDKLDEMATDGTLENLLNDVAHLTKSYSTYTDMIADSSTFTNGLRLKTLGYYSVNDGGGAEYYVNNSVVSSNYQVDLQNGLYLNLIINDYVIPEQFGVYGDGTHNDTTIFKNCCDFCYTNNKTLLLNTNKTYLIDTIEIYYINIEGNNATIKANNVLQDDYLIKFKQSNTIRTLINNITIDCDFNNGIILNDVKETSFTNLNIFNIGNYGLYYNSGYGLKVDNYYLRKGDNVTPSGTGIYLRTSDSEFINGTIVGMLIGVEDRGLNIFDNIHIWIPTAINKENTIGFRLKNSGIYTNVYIDSLQYGFSMTENDNVNIAYVHWLVYNDSFSKYLIYNETNGSLPSITVNNVYVQLSTDNTTNYAFCNTANNIIKNKILPYDSTNIPLMFPNITATYNVNLNVDSSRTRFLIVGESLFIHFEATATANINTNTEIITLPSGTNRKAKYFSGFINGSICTFYIGSSGQTYNSEKAINSGEKVIIDTCIPII